MAQILSAEFADEVAKVKNNVWSALAVAARSAPERFLILIPPFTPAACWCARTIVESMAFSSSAGGPRRLEDCIPYAELAPAGEAHEDRVPIAVSLGHVAPRRASAQNPQNAVGRSPLVRDGWTTFAPIRRSNGLRIRHSASVGSPRLNAASLRKAALKSFTYEKTVNTTLYGPRGSHTPGRKRFGLESGRVLLRHARPRYAAAPWPTIVRNQIASSLTDSVGGLDI